MKQLLTEERFAAFIGIDWADAKHDLCLQTDGYQPAGHLGKAPVAHTERQRPVRREGSH